MTLEWCVSRPRWMHKERLMNLLLRCNDGRSLHGTTLTLTRDEKTVIECVVLNCSCLWVALGSWGVGPHGQSSLWPEAGCPCCRHIWCRQGRNLGVCKQLWSGHSNAKWGSSNLMQFDAVCECTNLRQNSRGCSVYIPYTSRYGYLIIHTLDIPLLPGIEGENNEAVAATTTLYPLNPKGHRLGMMSGFVG